MSWNSNFLWKNQAQDGPKCGFTKSKLGAKPCDLHGQFHTRKWRIKRPLQRGSSSILCSVLLRSYWLSWVTWSGWEGGKLNSEKIIGSWYWTMWHQVELPPPPLSITQLIHRHTYQWWSHQTQAYPAWCWRKKCLSTGNILPKQVIWQVE